MRRRTARLQHLFGEFELDASLAFAISKRLVRQQRWMANDGGAGIPELMRDPFAVARQNVDRRNTKSASNKHINDRDTREGGRGVNHTHYFSVSALMVPVYLLCKCSSCEAAVYRRSDILYLEPCVRAVKVDE